MRLGRWLGRAALALLAVLALLTLYGYYATRERPLQTRTVLLDGELRAAPGASGRAHVRIFQAWTGQGALRHPLEQIASFETALGRFSHRIDYPLDGGEGLVVYAWLDTDGDGVHCTPTARNDPAGLVEVTAFPRDAVTVALDLDQPCAGPEFFYPR